MVPSLTTTRGENQSSISPSTVGCFRLKRCFPLLVVELLWPVCDSLHRVCVCVSSYAKCLGLAIGAVLRYLLACVTHGMSAGWVHRRHLFQMSR